MNDNSNIQNNSNCQEERSSIHNPFGSDISIKKFNFTSGDTQYNQQEFQIKQENNPFTNNQGEEISFKLESSFLRDSNVSQNDMFRNSMNRENTNNFNNNNNNNAEYPSFGASLVTSDLKDQSGFKFNQGNNNNDKSDIKQSSFISGGGRSGFFNQGSGIKPQQNQFTLPNSQISMDMRLSMKSNKDEKLNESNIGQNSEIRMPSDFANFGQQQEQNRMPSNISTNSNFLPKPYDSNRASDLSKTKMPMESNNNDNNEEEEITDLSRPMMREKKEEMNQSNMQLEMSQIKEGSMIDQQLKNSQQSSHLQNSNQSHMSFQQPQPQNFPKPENYSRLSQEYQSGGTYRSTEKSTQGPQPFNFFGQDQPNNQLMMGENYEFSRTSSKKFNEDVNRQISGDIQHFQQQKIEEGQEHRESGSVFNKFDTSYRQSDNKGGIYNNPYAQDRESMNSVKSKGIWRPNQFDTDQRDSLGELYNSLQTGDKNNFNFNQKVGSNDRFSIQPGQDLNRPSLGTNQSCPPIGNFL